MPQDSSFSSTLCKLTSVAVIIWSFSSGSAVPPLQTTAWLMPSIVVLLWWADAQSSMAKEQPSWAQFGKSLALLFSPNCLPFYSLLIVVQCLAHSMALPHPAPSPALPPGLVPAYALPRSNGPTNPPQNLPQGSAYRPVVNGAGATVRPAPQPTKSPTLMTPPAGPPTRTPSAPAPMPQNGIPPSAPPSNSTAK